eukprot:c5093_g1_i3.p1 GENE.c5093_g1_i3~~c5093_g1_i3.p1  ORF type:complete len:163 (+),score=36.62 c5093_g1_i3:208-696(+)
MENEPLVGSKPLKEGKWNTDLFDCFHDPITCICGSVCPGVIFGATQALLENPRDPAITTGCVYCIAWLTLAQCCLCCAVASTKRNEIRRRYKIKPHAQVFLDPWAIHVCFPCCAVCQEFREVRLQEGLPPLTPGRKQSFKQQHDQQQQIETTTTAVTTDMAK